MKRQLIQYPTSKKTQVIERTNTSHSASKRGMSLETLLNQANEYYLAHNKACIHKKPTPIQIVDVDYKSRATARITEAYFTVPSTTDYNGVYQGAHIDFEAKQTNLTSLPFHNFHEHQIEHMKAVLEQEGICFVIIYFKKTEQFFLIPAENIILWYTESKKRKDARKSISIGMAEKHGVEIKTDGYPILDYLAAIDQYFIGGKKID